MSSYYHSNAPDTWGTSNYRFARPREPHYRPTHTWNGLDYYQAHSTNPDPILYHRVREGQYDTEGVGTREARHWHRQAYGGFGDIRTLSPRDIGHAAAYEAYRIWIHNRNLSEMRSDYGQRREAFIAIAIAEVSHIFPTGQVHHERRKFREASETAAATASTIFQRVGDDGYSGGGSRHSSSPFRRAGSTSSDDFSDDLYAFDENVMSPRSLGHRRRSSSVSFNSRPVIIPPGGSPYQTSGSMPIPINQQSYSYSAGSPYQAGGSPYSNSYQGPSTFPQQYPGGVQGLPIGGSPYDPNQVALYQGAGSYPQQTYLQAQPGMTQAVPMVPGSYIIQQPTQQSSPRRKHRHKHRSGSRDDRHRHRAHSDAEYGYHY